MDDTQMSEMPPNTTSGGVPLTDELLAALAQAAEEGYPPEQLEQRFKQINVAMFRDSRQNFTDLLNQVGPPADWIDNETWTKEQVDFIRAAVAWAGISESLLEFGLGMLQEQWETMKVVLEWTTTLESDIQKVSALIREELSGNGGPDA